MATILNRMFKVLERTGKVQQGKKRPFCVYVVFINYPYVRRKMQCGVLCHPLSESYVFVLVVFLITLFVCCKRAETTILYLSLMLSSNLPP